MLVSGATFANVILGVHILAVIVGFGVTFAYPLLFAAATRTDPSMIPWLLRTRQRIGRYLVNPGLLVVVLAGIYLAADKHDWSAFFVQWGIIAALAIGAIEGALVIPRAGRLAGVAERDLAAGAVVAGGRRTSAAWSPEYVAESRRLSIAGIAVQLIVVVTVFVMATHA